MKKHYNYLDIDLDNSKIYRKLNAVQGDIKSRYTLVNLYSNNIPFDLSNCTVKIYGLKKDETIFFNNAVIKDAVKGQFEIELTNQALAVAGELKIQILILGTAGEKLTSSAFLVNVAETIIDEDAIESRNEFGALTEGLANLAEYDVYKQNISRHEIDINENKEKLNEHDEQFNTKANIDDITKLSTVTTKFANSVEEMTDTTVNYVNMVDGFLYRHNGSIFEKTTIKYQSTGLQDKSVTSVKLDSETSSRGYAWDKSPQSLGFNRAININYTIGQMNDNGTVNPSGSKARIYSDFFTVSNKKFTLYNKLNSIYKIGLITTDENGVKISASSNFTGWMQENKFDWIITNENVKKCYLNIARIDDAVMTDIDIENLIKAIMICDGEYKITYNLRTYEGDNAYIFSPYPFRIDTVNKTITCDGTYKVAGGKKLMNNMPFDISNLDLSKQGTFYVDWENSVIKWCVAFDYTTKTMSTGNTSIIGHTWTLNSTYGTYLELFTNSDIYVDGVRQENNGFSSRFKNKKFLFDGDSIMWGRTINGQTANPAIPDVVSRRLGVAFDKIAVPGACVTPKDTNDGQSLVERCVNNDYANYQYIVMDGGTNDYGYERQIGTIEDTDINTFYGAWNTIIKTIYAKNPKAKVMLITPIYRSYVNVSGSPAYGNVYNIRNGAGYTLDDYSDAMVKIGELYNIPVLDSRKNSVVNILNYTTRLCHDGDNKYLHPNDETYIDFGNIVASFIESKF